MLETKLIEVAPQQFKRVQTYTEDASASGLKAVKKDGIATSTVEVDGLVFNADELSMNRMARVVQSVNSDFNKKLSEGQTAAQAYSASFGVQLNWKLADNSTASVTKAQIVSALDKAIERMSAIWLANSHTEIQQLQD